MSPNPFKNAGSIQIRLTRNDNENQDDRIVIKYKDENIYQIYFQDGNTNAPTPTTWCTILSGEELDVYVESLFTLVSRDRDPFRSIEFQIPCFPALQYDVSDLKKTKIRDTILSLMPILYAAAKY
jgi:hypothetical protein